jgi:hypothetical protein
MVVVITFFSNMRFELVDIGRKGWREIQQWAETGALRASLSSPSMGLLSVASTENISLYNQWFKKSATHRCESSDPFNANNYTNCKQLPGNVTEESTLLVPKYTIVHDSSSSRLQFS